VSAASYPRANKEIMLIGYMRVSKADGSQVLDLQRDALISADVSPQTALRRSRVSYSLWGRPTTRRRV
jgi:hypothetical protein